MRRPKVLSDENLQKDIRVVFMTVYCNTRPNNLSPNPFTFAGIGLQVFVVMYSVKFGEIFVCKH